LWKKQRCSLQGGYVTLVMTGSTNIVINDLKTWPFPDMLPS
jgi:hypothetical protein